MGKLLTADNISYLPLNAFFRGGQVMCGVGGIAYMWVEE